MYIQVGSKRYLMLDNEFHLYSHRSFTWYCSCLEEYANAFGACCTGVLMSLDLQSQLYALASFEDDIIIEASNY